MMEVTVEVCRAFALTVSVKKTDRDHVHDSTAYAVDDGASRSSRANLQTVQCFTYLGDAVTETPVMSTEVARWTRSYRIRIRRFLRELHDQPKVSLSLNTRMIKAEARQSRPSRMDAVREPFAKNATPNSTPYTTGSCFAPSGHRTRDQTIG